MALIPLKSVRVRDAVPFAGPATVTLLQSQGKLEYDEESGLVIATPNKASGIAKAIAIPLGNVVYIEILDVAKAAVEAAKPPAPNFAEPVKATPSKDDTVVLKKGAK